MKDKGREKDKKPSFPLIPPSEIERFSWNKKGTNEFDLCVLKNGTHIAAYPSTGDVKQGDPVDHIWIDEAIQYPSHVAEWQARLSDNKGRLLWSSWPRMSNSALVDMTKRAQEQAEEVANGERSHADVEEFVLTFTDNPFIDDDEKRKRLEGWSEDERRARDKGEYITDNFLIYPQFNKAVHCAIPLDPEDDDALAGILRQRNGEPPANWTRELILDPGTQRPGILFCAVPPPGFGPYLVVYDEIYGKRWDADAIAKECKKRFGPYKFNRFIIDGQAARQTPMGFGVTIGKNYERAFRAEKLFCMETEERFTPGSSDELGRIQLVQAAMVIQKDGLPRLRVNIQKCPRLVEQLSTNVKAMEKEEISEKPLKGQKDDLRVCLEYWISRSPHYVLPVRTEEEIGGPGVIAYKMWKSRWAKKPQKKAVSCGPGALS